MNQPRGSNGGSHFDCASLSPQTLGTFMVPCRPLHSTITQHSFKNTNIAVLFGIIRPSLRNTVELIGQRVLSHLHQGRAMGLSRRRVAAAPHGEQRPAHAAQPQITDSPQDSSPRSHRHRPLRTKWAGDVWAIPKVLKHPWRLQGLVLAVGDADHFGL